MITLYDFASKLGEQTWNPNTFKTRISLNYKGIPFKTEWIEYTNIEPTLKKIGGPPTGKKSDGSDYYTLPAIHDSSTGKIIADSTAIAAYLDETYPDKPPLIPTLSTGASTLAAIVAFESVWMATMKPFFPLILPAATSILNPVSEAYFRSSREQAFGKKLEEFAPPGPIRDGLLKEGKELLDKVAAIYDKNGEGKQFFFGDTFSFADAIVIGFLSCLPLVLGEKEWKELATWNNGRWGKLVESTKNLRAVN